MDNRHLGSWKRIDCKLEKSGDLSFDFRDGSCGSFLFPEDREEIVVLCFPDIRRERNKCWSYDGLNSNKMKFISNIGHTRAGNDLGKYEGKPFIAGGADSDGDWNGQTEILSFKSGQWEIAEAYPFHEYIAHAAVVSVDDKVVLLGGHVDGPVNTVAAFANGSWSKIGELKGREIEGNIDGRRGHNSIQSGNDIFIIGGEGT